MLITFKHVPENQTSNCCAFFVRFLQPLRGPLRWKMLTLRPILHLVLVEQLALPTAMPCLPRVFTTVTWVLPPLPPITTTSTILSHAPSWGEEAPRLLSRCHAVLNSPLTSLPQISRRIPSPALLPHALRATAL